MRYKVAESYRSGTRLCRPYSLSSQPHGSPSHQTLSSLGVKRAPPDVGGISSSSSGLQSRKC